MKTQKSVIVVAGMHRSGTSATGGVLQALGIHLPGQLMGGNEFNSKGYFENERIVQFHDGLLARLGSSFDDPMDFSQGELDGLRAEGTVEDLARILLDETSGHPLTAFKDPRVCRLLPLWTQATAEIGAEMLVAVPLRHPVEVAASLTRRDRFSQAHGLLMWLEHSLASERDSRSHRRSFFLYPSLLENWRSVTGRIARDLDIGYPRDRHEAAGEIDAFVSDELRHHSSGTEGREADALRRTVQDTWEAHLALCEDPRDERALHTLDAVRERLASSGAMFREYVRSDRQSFHELRKHAIAVEEHRVDMGRHIVNLDAEIARFDERAEEMAREIEERDRRLEASSVQIAQSTQACNEMQGTVANLTRELESERRRLRFRLGDLDRAQQELDAARDALSGAERDVAVSLQTAARLRIEREEFRRDTDTARGEAEVARLEADEARRAADAMRAHAQTVEEHQAMLLRSNAWRVAQLSAAVMRRVPAPARRLTKRALRPLLRFILPAPAAAPEAIPAPADHQVVTTIPRVLEARDEGAATLVSGSQPSPSAEERQVAAIVADSVLFDGETYRGREEAEALGLSPALHYVLIGEAKNYAPSEKFDPRFYGLVYPDVESAGLNKLHHYLTAGAMEGRRPLFPSETFFLPQVELDPGRPTILVIAHDASRSGAPVLAWNIVHHLKAKHNVLTLLLGSGPLVENFREESDLVIGPLEVETANSAFDAGFIVASICGQYDIDFVIANSIATRIYATAFAYRSIPVVTLSHEFAAYTRPHGVLNEIFTVSDEVVFSADAVLRQSEKEYPILAARHVHILPQGQCVVPPAIEDEDTAERKSPTHDAALRPADAPDTFIVVGLGTVEFRKGVDLFVSAAAAAMRARPDLQFRFVWYGYRPHWLEQYTAHLDAQIETEGLSRYLEIREPVEDLSSIYRQADALALTSRLDPLPNVAIDAAMAGIPVVCFDGAGGFPDILSSNRATAGLVVPHLDSTAAGELIAELAGESERRLAFGTAIHALAERTFRMKDYVETLAELGRNAAERRTQKLLDEKTIREDGTFDPDFYRGFAFHGLDDDGALALYMNQPHSVEALASADLDPEMRGPMPGFHPLRFAHEHLNYGRAMTTEPFAEYIRQGRPAGPWSDPIITPGRANPRNRDRLRSILHGHFHYPELVPDFMEAFASNRFQCDLFLTVTRPDAVEAVEAAGEAFANGDVTVRLVPNAGRDIGPFLTEFAEYAAPYDVVGHLHGKRSVFLETRTSNYGNRWRDFLWRHLIGPDHAMADVIIDRMIEDPQLGLVFPADPHLVGWSKNRAIAEDLAMRLRLSRPLPSFFSFPIGTMFWARRAAIQPLFDLGLNWDDYPLEPVGEDGTLLHALERIVPHVVTDQGFTVAATYLRGVKR